jgi:hypothetical protein
MGLLTRAMLQLAMFQAFLLVMVAVLFFATVKKIYTHVGKAYDILGNAHSPKYFV